MFSVMLLVLGNFDLIVCFFLTYLFVKDSEGPINLTAVVLKKD